MQTFTNLSAIPYSTFRFNAKLVTVYQCETLADLRQLSFTSPPVVLGEGSNTIFMQDLLVPVCRYTAESITVADTDTDHVLVHVEAGHNWHQLVSWSVQNRLWGIENLALIPGTVGAAPVQNIGAYGVELADVCSYVDFYNWHTNNVERINSAECQFGYRDSIFKKELNGKGVIVSVGLRLSHTPKPILNYKGLDHLRADVDIETVFNAVVATRNSKLPDPKVLANCGSFFKNPVVSLAHYQRLLQLFPDLPGYKLADNNVKVPAAWCIDQQGFKGKQNGGIGCYELQPLVLVNRGEGTAAQLRELIAEIQQKVLNVYDIKLEPEVRMLNADGCVNV
ncbi:UDP-N-acetylmuramate dehydrogenase [Rheinheimera aquimaris]|uniref:UDP-N-acetylenolpyruvoylglucosamine reductase n=1 Tax=Rheinheimera aquimaris TaxID=412437 RepID=A0ABP3PIG6_9GAMM|nr:UDP-N-acetylmuramate dehydrogenase [Rheinheimera aquimaris]MCB5215671.1 UDP-N-acetylmuramate dehydrogenase [Rheinheimera aquimaris]